MRPNLCTRCSARRAVGRIDPLEEPDGKAVYVSDGLVPHGLDAEHARTRGPVPESIEKLFEPIARTFGDHVYRSI